ncbi:MAG: exosortase/archaeosortase family protein [Pirellulales bacterium]
MNGKPRPVTRPSQRTATARAAVAPQSTQPLLQRLPPQPLEQRHIRLLASLAGVLGIIFLWSYAPDLSQLAYAWRTEPDYSHGILVVPIALFCLWARRDAIPTELTAPDPWGLGLILLSVAWRVLAEKFFLPEVANWSLIPFIAGCCWLLAGRKFFLWALPSILFLFFMTKLPFRAETLLGTPLRRLSCHLASWFLQCLGQPAIPEWTTISLGAERLEVAQACAGLRMFIGVFALVCAYLMVSQRAWWQKLFLLAFVAPVAVVANSARIVVTGLMYQWVSSEFGRQFAHDFAGWLVIPMAAVLFLGGIWFLDRAFIQVPRQRTMQPVA